MSDAATPVLEDRLKSLVAAWEAERVPLDPADVMTDDATPHRRWLAAAAAVLVALVVAGVLVITHSPEGAPRLSTVATQPDEQPPLVGPPTWGPPAQLIPFEGDLLVVSEPPWDSTVIPDGPGGLSRVDLDTGEVTVLTEIPALSRADLDGTGHLWVTAGPNRVLRIDPATGNVLGETLLPEATPIVPPTVLPGSSTAETGPIVVEASPTGTDAWILRSSGITTDVFHLTADDASTPASVITLGGNAHAAELTADGGLWIALGTGGLTRLDTQTLDTDEIGVMYPDRDSGMSVVGDVLATDDAIWVAGSSNGTSAVFTVRVDLETSRVTVEEPVAGISLVPGHSGAPVLADGEVRSQEGEALASVPPGARTAVIVDGQIWSAGAFWVANEAGNKIGLPGRTIAAPSVQTPGAHEDGLFATDPPMPVFTRADGRLRWELVEPFGSRLEVSVPDSIPWQGEPTVSVSLTRANPEPGEIEGVSELRRRPPEEWNVPPTPCTDTCAGSTALSALLRSGWITVSDRVVALEQTAAEYPELMEGVQSGNHPRYDASMSIDRWMFSFDVDDPADAVKIAEQLKITATKDGFPVITDPSGRLPKDARFTVELKPQDYVNGITITLVKGCHAQSPYLPADGWRCIGGYSVGADGPDRIGIDILGTIQVRPLD